MKTIGFFQKWNKDAQTFEFSITRLQMVLFTIFTGFFTYQFYITEGNSVTINSIVLILILLSAGFFPKVIKDFVDLKNKL